MRICLFIILLSVTTSVFSIPYGYSNWGINVSRDIVNCEQYVKNMKTQSLMVDCIDIYEDQLHKYFFETRVLNTKVCSKAYLANGNDKLTKSIALSDYKLEYCLANLFSQDIVKRILWEKEYNYKLKEKSPIVFIVLIIGIVGLLGIVVWKKYP